MRHLKHEKFFEHTALLFVASLVASVTNMLFHVIMGRTLSHAEYATLTAMLNVVNLINTPIEAVRTAVAHFTTRLIEEDHARDIKELVALWCKRISWFTVPTVVIGFAFARPLAAFFQLESTAPILLTTVILAISPYMAITMGSLLGLQAFVWMSLAVQSWSVVRVVAGWLFVILIAPYAIWGLNGQILGVVVSTGLGLGALHVIVGRSRPSGKQRGWREHYYFGSSLAALAGLAVLMNADMILIKHYFPADEAGRYARAFVIGRIVIFLTTPIALAMFPKVVSEGDASLQDWKTLSRAVLTTLVIVVSAVVGVLVLPRLPLVVLYGSEAATPEAVGLLRAVIVAMSPLGVTLVLTHFELAQHRFGTVPSLLFCAAVYVVGVVIWHDTIAQIITVLGSVAALSIVLLLVNLAWKGRGRTAEER